jgi:hypothetical protein
MHLQRSELVEARAALDEAGPRQRELRDHFGIRHQLLALHLDAAEGLAEPDRHTDADAVLEDWDGEDSRLAAIYLGFAELEYKLWPDSAAKGNLRAALGFALEWLPFNKWRLDASLRSLPPALIEAAVSEQERVEVIVWLERRQLAGDLDWDEIWTKYLMIERAIGHTERVAQLVGLGRKWLLARPGVYEVWRPLVEIHIEMRDASTLEQLVRMPLSPDAERRFGPRLAAALHIVADLVARGIVELPDAESELRSRAAARGGMPLGLRLGWWAIELALTRA